MTYLVHVAGQCEPVVCNSYSGADATRRIMLEVGLFARITSL